MQKHGTFNYLFYFFVGGICLSLTSGNYSPHYTDSNREIKPGVSNDSSSHSPGWDRANNDKEFAYLDPYEQSNDKSYSQNNSSSSSGRMGNWDYKENWRYNREAFFKGETQPQAYREKHPYGPSGIGYDADENWVKEQRYLSNHTNQYARPSNQRGQVNQGNNQRVNGNRNSNISGFNNQNSYTTNPNTSRNPRPDPSSYNFNQKPSSSPVENRNLNGPSPRQNFYYRNSVSYQSDYNLNRETPNHDRNNEHNDDYRSS